MRYRAAAILLAAAWGLAPAWAAAPQSGPRVVHLGVLAHRGAEESQRTWGPTAEYLSAALPGHRFELVPLTHRQINRAVAAGRVAFVLTNPANYVELEAACGATRIATLRAARNGSASPLFGAVIFTRAGRSDIRGLADLKGKSFAAYDEHAFGGWWMAWREFKAAGIVPETDFASLRFTGGSQDDVVYAVRSGKADAGTVRTDLLEAMAKEGKIAAGEFRVLNPQAALETFPYARSTRLYPEWPAAALPGAGEELARQVAVALMQMPADGEAARAASCAGWTVPQDYTPVHELMRELRLGPYEMFGRISHAEAARQYWLWLAAAVGVVLLLVAVIVHQYRKGSTIERLDARAALPSRALKGGAMRRIAQGLGLAVAAVGAGALAGWMADVPWLKSLVPGLKAMNPTSAAAFVLAGAALAARATFPGRAARRACGAAACLVAAVGALRIAGYLGPDAGVDRLFWPDVLGANRMAPNAAACFLLAGGALLGLDVTTRRGYRPSDWLLLAGAALALMALIGYVFEARFFYAVGTAVPMSLNSAAAFLLLFAGILCTRPERGLISMVAGATPGGVMLRTLLPAAVGIPVVLGGLRLMGQRLGLYEPEVGLSLFALTTTLVFILVVWWNAGLLHRLDGRRKQAEDSLRKAHGELEGRVRERTGQLQEANESLEASAARIVHLNAVLRSIQHINQLVIREQDPHALARKACETLTRTRGYQAAWIALLERPGKLAASAQSGLGESFEALDREMADWTMPPCARQALEKPGLVRVLAPETLCAHCTLGTANPGRRAFVTGLAHGGTVNGLLAVYTDRDAPADPEEQDLLEELAGDIGLALHKMAVEGQKKDLEERYLQAQKMEAIGRLAGGVAHDFRNQLTVIAGYCDLLLHDLTPDSPLRPDLDEIRKAAARSNALTGQLLAFSRRQVLVPQALNLNDVLADMAAPLATMLGEDIELVLRRREPLPCVQLDRAGLEQAILNLVSNARDAMPNGGTLTIRTSTATLTQAHAQAFPDSTPGDYCALTVSDTGAGMDEETRRRAFEPFFTTKEKGKGTGLGLSMVYGFVRQSGGWIHLASEPGEGTTFRIHIPQAAGEPAPAPAQAPAAQAPPAGSGHETILVAEDEGPVRDFVVASLRRRGYRVLEAPDAQEALAVAAGFDGAIDLLLTDVVMPRMSGPELAQRLRETRAGTKVLYMSGYTSGQVVEQWHLTPGVNLIAKPFGPESLARRVRLALDS